MTIIELSTRSEANDYYLKVIEAIGKMAKHFALHNQEVPDKGYNKDEIIEF